MKVIDCELDQGRAQRRGVELPVDVALRDKMQRLELAAEGPKSVEDGRSVVGTPVSVTVTDAKVD